MLTEDGMGAGTMACINFLALSGVFVQRDRLKVAYCAKTFLILGSGLLMLGYSVYAYSHQISDFAVALHHLLLLVSVLFVILYYYAKRSLFSRLVRELYEKYDYGGFLSEEVLTRARVRNLHSGRVVRLIYFFIAYNYITIIFIAFVDRYLWNGEYVLFPCWLPFELNSSARYVGVFLWESFILWEIELGIFGSMVASYLIYGRMTDELKTLQSALATIRQRALASATKGPHQDIRRNLIICTDQCARHHNRIISYFNTARLAFRTVYFIVMVSGLFIMVITGLALISEDTFQKVKFITIALTEMVYIFGMCWFAEEIADESTAVGSSAYGYDWMDMPKSCWKTLCLIMARSHRPLRLHAITGTEVSLDTFMSVMKAAYSYFNMLFAYHKNRTQG